jgi:osmotically-inducible protein OsmY
MADGYQYDDRSRRERYQRGSGQAEQFQTGYDYDDERSLGQMGDGWRGQEGQRDNSWQSGQNRYDRERGQQGSRGGYGSDYGQSGPERYGSSSGASRYAQGGSSDYQNRGFQGGSQRSRTSGGGSGSFDGPSWDTSSGAGSQLARSHGEWHDRNGGYGRSGGYGASSDGRGFLDRAGETLERAGETVAGWFSDDDSDRQRSQSYRGQGPANYKRSDERLLEDACEQLTQDHRVDARNIQVTVQNGELTLDGTVTSRDQKRRAEDCVENLSGVKHVQNNLRVQEGSTWDRNNSGDRAQTGASGGSTADPLSGGTGLTGSTANASGTSGTTRS